LAGDLALAEANAEPALPSFSKEANYQTALRRGPTT
jgi:hypothetical protein